MFQKNNNTTANRSYIMSRIKGKDTQPELLVRRLIYGMGFRYRLHRKDLPGKPDITFSSRKKVIFVHGCFWHQHHGCKVKHIPKSNIDYWKPKLRRTIIRDKANQKKLIAEGWKYLILWECQLKNIDIVKQNIQNFLVS
jgi:DNA mismatch endonuclease (patch repair protein)